MPHGKLCYSEFPYLRGNATFFAGDSSRHHERHEMWRIYPASKADAHAADGKVRIRSEQAGVTVLDLAYDGHRTFVNGELANEPDARRRWAANFGFGAIRHALDAGYSVSRLPDDQVDGAPGYMVRVTDPSGSDTLFAIAMDDYAILMVAFDTPRGWHQRVYSEFFLAPGSRWRQPGLVRLYVCSDQVHPWT